MTESERVALAIRGLDRILTRAVELIAQQGTEIRELRRSVDDLRAELARRHPAPPVEDEEPPTSVQLVREAPRVLGAVDRLRWQTWIGGAFLLGVVIVIVLERERLIGVVLARGPL